ncbi:MAG: hypothetical protein V1888_03690 [archaeon]
MTEEFYGYLDIKNSFSRIDETIKSIDEFYPHDAGGILLQNFFTDYLIVLILRTVEGSTKNIILTNLKLRNPQINLEKVENRLFKFNNPTLENIQNLFFDFLQIEIDNNNFLEEELRDMSIINKYRQNIAHSNCFLDYENYNRSYPQIKKQYENIKKYILKLCELYH